MYTQDEQKRMEDAALAIGQALKVEREKSNFSLLYIADITRLSSAHLEALEAGNFASLPGVGYIPGYIRNYCKTIGIDSTSYIARFKALSNEVTKKPEYSFPVQALVPRIAGSMVAMSAVLVGLAVYVGWTVLSYNQAPDDELISSTISQSEQPAILIESKAGLSGQPLKPAVQPDVMAGVVDNTADNVRTLKTQLDTFQPNSTTEAAAVNQNPPLRQIDAVPDKIMPEGESLTQNNRITLATADNPVGSAPLPTATQKNDLALKGVAAQATSRVPEEEVVIKATASAWIEVTRADGEVLVTRLMRDGDELLLSTNDDLFLSTGNAGGLRLEMLNLSAFDAGQTGEILRDLRLNRESLVTRHTQLTY